MRKASKPTSDLSSTPIGEPPKTRALIRRGESDPIGDGGLGGGSPIGDCERLIAGVKKCEELLLEVEERLKELGTNPAT